MKNALIVVLFSTSLAWGAGPDGEIPFEKHTIDLGVAETCALADINGDGRLDIVAGENWFEAPQWKRHRFRELEIVRGYVDVFSDHAIDVNGDGNVDVVSNMWFARKIVWYENPGKGQGLWKEHGIDSGFQTEFSFLVDLDNDGQARELLPQYGPTKAPQTWFEIRDGGFVKHVVSPTSYGHGIGAGDVNGDGRNDILASKGWWEAPPDPRNGQWEFHEAFDLSHLGFLHVIDVNGDGRNDVVTSLSHDYGIFWLEHGEDGKWTKHMIDDTWSQPHATTFADLNGDGQPDLLTGKRFLAHNGRDPGGREPLGVYWYEFRKAGDGTILWLRHMVDYSSRAGGGMQIPVADVDGDGDPDFVTPGKGGLFLFDNKTR